MSSASNFFGSPTFPAAQNEPVKEYLEGSPERKELLDTLKRMRGQAPLDIPLIIGGKEVRTGNTVDAVVPHDHGHVLAKVHQAGPAEIQAAIQAAADAKEEWMSLPNPERLQIFRKAADLIAGPYRAIINASTILGQSKNIMQAEIDAACELIDFLRFNASFAEELYTKQPISTTPGVWNRSELRPLEGFIYAVTPFNFTAIAGNLPGSPAMMGNTIVWKPSQYSLLSNYYLMQVFKEAGLPDGVVNFVPGDAVEVTNTALASPDFAGLHYTGSSKIFQQLWKNIGDRITVYKSYPRIVGEAGGKDFMFLAPSGDPQQFCAALMRGAFEYAGQKCSAASRAYVPASMWPAVKARLATLYADIKTGNPEDPTTFVNAVISRPAFDRNKEYIDMVNEDPSKYTVLHGGTYDDSKGYFIHPTIVECKEPQCRLMSEEIFGPVLGIYVYPDASYHDTLDVCNNTSGYALTGAIWAKDVYQATEASRILGDAAGNFYINDRCTGSVVGQQPFGGGRLSGTNDKAGSYLNLLRWVNARSIKESSHHPEHFIYPYMK